MLQRIRSKNLHTWLAGYGRHVRRSLVRPRYRGLRHLIFALCDHYEPLWRGADTTVGQARVRTWVQRYPQLTEPYRDADGRRPQHTFFFPGEEYRPPFFDLLGELVSSGCGEVELHLHHDRSSAAELRAAIDEYLSVYASRGHLSRGLDGRPRYGFIHGNWALANARADGRHCGVDEELPLLFDTGCYADFTFPSAPDPSQPNIVNQIYWPRGDLSRRRAYEAGEQARVGKRFHDRILMVQGPLALALRAHRMPVRIENGAVTADNPATARRVRTWVAQSIHVEGRPEWVFVKAYTHGAQERQAASLLGSGGHALHTALARYNDGRRWKLHYVTAREMYNIAVAAMAGRQGDPADYRDLELPPPPLVAAHRSEA